MRSAAGWHRAGWLLVAVLFTYMAVDDGAQLHERFATAFDTWRQQEAGLAGRFPSYTWQFVYLPLLAMLAAFVVLFLWSAVHRPAHRVLVIAGLGVLVLDHLKQAVGEVESHPSSNIVG